MSSKRTNGKGSLRLRSDGRWECTLMDTLMKTKMNKSCSKDVKKE